ncbi:hypothetical protein HDU80_004053 [Chytriomyces hyalinus]|nr:hypothetical protein HDU80_004053 [Chytriomyces hyalinus]
MLVLSFRQALLRSMGGMQMRMGLRWSSSEGASVAAAVEAASDSKAAAAAAAATDDTASWLTHPSVMPSVGRAVVERFKFTGMTPVQRIVMDTQPGIGSRRDMLVRSKTGTGKTLAFLAAAVQAVNVEREFEKSDGPKGVDILIFSPTRELAVQTGYEARKLLGLPVLGKAGAVHSSGNYVTVVVGGESKNPQLDGVTSAYKKSRKSLSQASNGISIVIATPGRMWDIATSNQSVQDALRNVKIVIFDECDLLLEMGFQKTIQEILQFVPKPNKRNTFMFSATLSNEAVRALAADQLVNKPVHEIDATVIAADPLSPETSTSDETHAHVPQTYALVPHYQWAFILYKAILSHVALHNAEKNPPRIMLFFNTSKEVAYFSKVFSSLPEFVSASESGRFGAARTPKEKDLIRVYEMHARLEQSKRAKVSDAFRNDTGGPSIMLTTDVSARGVDYPHVSYVIQSGAPTSAPQYVHRVGRTGRAGRSGIGLLLLEPFEKAFLKTLLRKGSIEIVGDVVVDSWVESADEKDKELRTRVKSLMQEFVADTKRDLKSAAEGCYLAFLGHYKQAFYLTKPQAASAAQSYARNVLCLADAPTLSFSLATKMGLMNTPDINVEPSPKGLKRLERDMKNRPPLARVEGSFRANPWERRGSSVNWEKKRRDN